MWVVALVSAAAAASLLSFLLGVFCGQVSSRRRLKEAARRYDALRQDFDAVSAINVRLLRGAKPNGADRNDEKAEQQFLDLYDEAKRRLHHALDVHNATAQRPIVIAKNGGNLVQVLREVPEFSFSDDAGEDSGVRAWLTQVFEMDAERRSAGKPPHPSAVLVLERERLLWDPLLKPRP